MKLKQGLIGLVGLALVCFVAACGDGSGQGSSCEFNIDCAPSEACVSAGSSNQCATLCGGDGGVECTAGSSCRLVSTPNSDDEARVCVTDEDPTDSGMPDAGDAGDMGVDGGSTDGCSSDSECNPPETVCDTDRNECIPAVRYMQVTEVTKRENPDATDAACGASADDPGADMLSLQLLDNSGATIGYAENVNSNEFSTNADLVFDGDATDAVDRGDNNELCAPEGQFDDSAVVLGCRDSSEIGNGLVVQFRPAGDVQGPPITLKPGMQLFAAEHGPFCCTTQSCRDNSVDEYYELELCSASTQDDVQGSQSAEGNFPTCDTGGLVSATGETSYEVTLDDLQ